MYFKAIKNINYPFFDTHRNVKDIFNRVTTRGPKVNKTTLNSYMIKDGETPDILSHKLYGNTRYHWIFFLINEIVDPYAEWPIPNSELLPLVREKYNDSTGTKVHHYRETTGDRLVVDLDPSRTDIEPVTNYEYEFELNEQKRMILILKPIYLKDFVKSYKTLVGA